MTGILLTCTLYRPVREEVYSSLSAAFPPGLGEAAASFKRGPLGLGGRRGVSVVSRPDEVFLD